MAKSSPTATKSAVQIGPLSGGLNNISKAGEARDAEVVELINLEVSLDQSLTSRPPIEAIPNSTLPSTNTIGWEVLGIYRVTSSQWYLIVTLPKDGTTNTDTTVRAYLNGIVGVGETITTIKQSVGIGNRVTSMVQFNDTLYFNVNFGATDTGFKWKTGDALGGTAIATMPKGSVMLTWKSRIWISGTAESTKGDRVFFSTIDGTGTHPDTWGVADFFDVEPGAGGFVTAMIPSFNNLIIFKDDGTWRFSYAASPASGQVEKISGSVGCASKRSVVDFENYMYVYDQGRVYELVNSSFTQVNRFVLFSEDDMGVDSSAPDIEMSVVNRRLLVRYFNAVYCFSVDTKAWSQWRTYNGTPGRFLELPADSQSTSPSKFIAASKGLTQSISANLIVDSSFNDAIIKAARAAIVGGTVTYSGNSATLSTATPPASMLLNSTGVSTDYDFPVSTGQQFQFDFTISAITGTTIVDIKYLITDGTTSTSSSASYTTTGLKTSSYTAPAGAILCTVAIRQSASGSVTFNSPSFIRKSVTAPFNLMRITDTYPSQAAALEFIECSFQTKSYDYRTPGNFKHLFWAGIDIKTFEKVYTEARPVSTVGTVLWGDLEAYTWTQLEQGTWNNPLSWLTSVFAIFNILNADDVQSENGRYFKKIAGAMRFRQISYKLKTSTFGNASTGPVKFFSLTSYVSIKQKVVDSST